jgi:hypothetical protein
LPVMSTPLVANLVVADLVSRARPRDLLTALTPPL